MIQYHVDAFIPSPPGCMKMEAGWDPKRCQEFASFLNKYGAQGWRLHSCEYRTVAAGGCGTTKGSWLVCVFERGT